MSKKVIRLTESELKNYIRKIVSEQGGSVPDSSYESNFYGDDTKSTQTGEPIVPYEMKGPSAPTSSISPEDLAKSIAGIAKAQKGAKFLQYIKQWGHTSKDTWDDATIEGYAPYTSPQLKTKAKKEGYFPFPNMASKRADDAKRGNNVQQRPVPQQTLRINPNLSFDQNVYVIQQQLRRDLTPKEKSQIDKAISNFKIQSSLGPTPQQDQLIRQRIQQSQQNLRRNLTPSEIDYIKSTVMNQSPQQQGPPPQQGQRFN
jgi:hypothetical protein